jgi:hypothetical protein
MCFIRILQVFYLDIVKADLDVAYVAMAIHVRCKCMFQIFQLFSDICCKCIFQMFELFQTYIASVLSGCCKAYLNVIYIAMTIQICFKCILHML